MKRVIFGLILLMTIMAGKAQENGKPVVLVIHGGAGNIVRGRMTAEKEQAYRDVLQKALDTGYAILENGGSSIDAVEAAIVVMEDSPLFNAGKGAVFTAEGKNEMDASIMDGKTLNAGAVAAVTNIKNPVKAARLIMQKSPHVMLTGRGAEQFAEEQGLQPMPAGYFHDELRYKQWKKIKDSEKIIMDHDGEQGDVQPSFDAEFDSDPDHKYGTVGAVALDADGNLAAATSTGGMTNKSYGRVGDSPIIGSGSYANNKTCAVSSTGHGEFFIRTLAAYDISAQMEYLDLPVDSAAQQTIDKIGELGGGGGVICVSKNGKIAMPFNTKGMYRGFKTSTGEEAVQIYGD
jgi:beta-aspartyl-peptidase (threonine type)